jgi:hypothetical protein
MDADKKQSSLLMKISQPFALPGASTGGEAAAKNLRSSASICG